MPRYCPNGFLMSLTVRYPIIKLQPKADQSQAEAGVPMGEEASLKTDGVGPRQRRTP